MTGNVHESDGSRTKLRNPFYTAIGILGGLFVVTAVAYGLMLYQATRPAGNAPHAGHPLYALMDQYGTAALVAQVALLGVLTVAAIRTDDYWAGRNRGAQDAS